jgi:CubicO group peptidase (beta-lactamase class C family)
MHLTPVVARRAGVIAVIVAAAGPLACAGRGSARTEPMEYESISRRRPPALHAAIRDSVRRVLEAARADSAFPAGIVIVGDRDGELAEVTVGQLDWAPSPPPDRHTLWDLASLTKVIGTTTALMQLAERGAIDVDAPVQRYLPMLRSPNIEHVTLRHLLTHSSGLPSFKAYDQQTHDPDSLAALMLSTPLDTLPGARMVYSDIGAYLLGRTVEAVSGKKLDAYLAEHVFQPLDMRESMFRPSRALLPRIAPTEVDPLRGGLVRGNVHDERAYYLGGVSAHAGLFSSAADLSRFARMMLNGGTLDGARVLNPETIRRFTAYADSAFSNRALGWQKIAVPGMRFATPAPVWGGTRMASASYGHTGFTGTSIAIDPVRDLYIILLTNRVNPTRNNNKIGRVRSALTDAVLAALSTFPPAPGSPP